MKDRYSDRWMERLIGNRLADLLASRATNTITIPHKWHNNIIIKDSDNKIIFNIRKELNHNHKDLIIKKWGIINQKTNTYASDSSIDKNLSFWQITNLDKNYNNKFFNFQLRLKTLSPLPK